MFELSYLTKIKRQKIENSPGSQNGLFLTLKERKGKMKETIKWVLLNGFQLMIQNMSDFAGKIVI